MVKIKWWITSFIRFIHVLVTAVLDVGVSGWLDEYLMQRKLALIKKINYCTYYNYARIFSTMGNCLTVKSVKNEQK